MTALPEHHRDFDSELEPAQSTVFAAFRWTRRITIDRDYVDELQAWADGFEPRPRWATDLPSPPDDAAAQIDRAAGEYFRGTWRRRLTDAQGDCGYVARQMRKAGVPLDLALVILLMPDPAIEPQQVSIWPPERVGWPWRETTPGLPVPRTPVQAASLRLDASSGPTRQPGQAAHRQADVTEAAIA